MSSSGTGLLAAVQEAQEGRGDQVDQDVIVDRMERKVTTVHRVHRISKRRFSCTSPTTDGELRLAVFHFQATGSDESDESDSVEA